MPRVDFWVVLALAFAAVIVLVLALDQSLYYERQIRQLKTEIKLLKEERSSAVLMAQEVMEKLQEVNKALGVHIKALEGAFGKIPPEKKDANSP